MPYVSPWADLSKVAELRRLWNPPVALRVAEIARRLNVSDGAVTSKAHRMGLVARRNPSLPMLPKLTNTLPLIVGRRGPCARTTLPTLESTVGVVLAAPVAPRRSVAECCWPVSNGRPWRFCDAPTVAGNRYCEKHLRLSMFGNRGSAAEATGAVHETAIASAPTGLVSTGESPGEAATTTNASESSHAYAKVITSDENTGELGAFAC